MSVTPFTTGVKDGQAGRRALLAAAAAAGLAPIGAARGAGTYPERPVRVVVPFPAGGSVDIVARLVAQDLARTHGQPFVVDNRSGASGSIGTEFVAKSAPDGHTLLMGSAVSLAGNVSLYRNLPYDPVRDFAPISLVALQPNMVIVHPSLPVRTIAELIAYEGAAGRHQLRLLRPRLDAAPVRRGVLPAHQGQHGARPYRGGAPALNDLIAGQVQLMFETIPTALQAARAGQVRPIAVTTARRSEAMPDLPTVAESGLPGYETRGWIGLAAPAGTPKEIVDLLAARTPEIARSPQVRSRLVDLGLEVVAGTPEQFGRFIRSEIESIRAVVTAAGVTPQ